MEPGDTAAMTYDHVVIGSGINGLVCAALLSKVQGFMK
jgi:L-2-hydroxyglutarate oxidase LhgO